MKRTIGEKIRWLRQKQGNSQRVIADLLGISVPAFWKIESGATDISINRLNQIADIFNIKASSLLDDDEPGAKSGENPEIGLLKDKLISSEQEVIRLQNRLLKLYEDVEHYVTRSGVNM